MSPRRTSRRRGSAVASATLAGLRGYQRIGIGDGVPPGLPCAVPVVVGDVGPFHLVAMAARSVGIAGSPLSSVNCGSRIFMQPSEDRHGEGHGRLGIQQHCRVPPLVRDDRQARRYSRIGVFATDGSNPDMTT